MWNSKIHQPAKGRAVQVVMADGCQWVCSGTTAEPSVNLVGCTLHIARSALHFHNWHCKPI